MRIIALGFFVLALCLSASSQKHSLLKIKTSETGFDFLKNKGLTGFQGVLEKDYYFTAYYSEKEIAKLDSLNVNYSVVYNDVTDFYNKRNIDLSTKESKSIFNSCGSAPYFNTPNYWNLGSMGGFYTLDEAYAELDSMVLLFPDLVYKTQIGTHVSYEGRPIYQVKISDNPSAAEAEPQVLYTSIHHSQEPASLQQLIFYMYYLLENYNSNPEIKYIVDNTELFFVPVINPDGYVYNQTQNPTGGGMHRKNRHTTMFSDGVDLNRNYDYAFAYNEIGSSSIGFHPWHRGDFAFSEPETQAMKYLIENNNFKIALNWHSYGNYLIYPYNYDSDFVPENIDIYKNFARFLTLENNYRYGTCDETYGYNSNGDADDWATGIHDIVSITAEVGNSDDGFWPEISRIETLCRENVAMNKKIALLANSYAEVNDLSINIYDQIEGYFPFELQCLGLDTPSVFLVSIEPISPYILSVGGPKTFNNVSTLDVLNDSISYYLNPSILNGQEFSFVVNVNNSLFTFRDTITKVFGEKTILLNDHCNDLSNWTTDDFVATNEDFSSLPTCFTESEGSNYGLLQTSELVLNNELDLTNAFAATLSFKTKFETEKSYDWYQVYASIDNGSYWQALCGRLSSHGTDDQNFGEPVWDGTQAYWIMEEILLDDFIGENLLLKFVFKSDQTNTYDGVYLDDIAVTIIDNQCVGIDNSIQKKSFQIVPNPAKDYFSVVGLENSREKNKISITDITGRTIAIFNNVEFEKIEISNLNPGNYLINISSEGIIIGRNKLIIVD
ncbi:MAG: immune inhibitor A [Bacteroidales bacterium]|nr:immune inhibitor A [Bacteroidales bacterium]